ncbi:MAG TPA: S8 family peptidase [Alphaproteobacteria bacterium]|nr:S8 family peptidase [Alphaproteobacteria bacterium]
MRVPVPSRPRQAGPLSPFGLAAAFALILAAVAPAKAAPDDPYFKSKGAWGQKHDDQWGLKRIGLTAEKDSAWALLGPKPQPVVVAVIDTGLDWNHLDFDWNNLWRNPKEIPDNGTDDDGNGYVDDIIGWDFLANVNTPFDHDGHGTLTAGIIAAASDNKIGIAGVNPHARIMVLKALNAFGQTRASYIAKAIVYAADNGARIVNLSVGHPTLTRIEQAAIAYARKKGVLIVVAAGNAGIETGGFGLASAEGVLTVAATNPDDSHPGFSNWGPEVDIAAPGVDILSLRARRTDTLFGIPGVEYAAGTAYVGEDKRYYRAGGTSFAAPFVAGVASLLLSKQPELTVDQLERILMQSAEDIQTPGLDQFSGAGLVNARRALTLDPAFSIEAAVTGVEVVQASGKPAIKVLGTAAANAFKSAKLEIGEGEDPAKFKTVVKKVSAVAGGALGVIPAKEFGGSSVWTIRLVVSHRNGETREARFVLDVGG